MSLKVDENNGIYPLEYHSPPAKSQRVRPSRKPPEKKGCIAGERFWNQQPVSQQRTGMSRSERSGEKPADSSTSGNTFTRKTKEGNFLETKIEFVPSRSSL